MSNFSWGHLIVDQMVIYITVHFYFNFQIILILSYASVHLATNVYLFIYLLINN
jgi:hypothetical protein